MIFFQRIPRSEFRKTRGFCLTHVLSLSFLQPLRAHRAATALKAERRPSYHRGFVQQSSKCWVSVHEDRWQEIDPNDFWIFLNIMTPRAEDVFCFLIVLFGMLNICRCPWPDNVSRSSRSGGLVLRRDDLFLLGQPISSHTIQAFHEWWVLFFGVYLYLRCIKNIQNVYCIHHIVT